MTTTDWVFGGFLFFVALWVLFIWWGLRQARKQVEKMNAELAERDARWLEFGRAEDNPGPDWSGPWGGPP